MTRVLFVAGAARSGTTVFSQVLSTSDRYIHIGELTYIWERGLVEDQLCGCGEPFSSCGFWTEVMQLAFGAPRPPRREIDRLIQLRHEVDDMPSIPFQMLGARRTARGAYAVALAHLIEAASVVSGAAVVIDSSKRPSHGLALRASQLDVRVVHIVRDPRAVAFSETRRRRRPEVWSHEAYMSTAPPQRNAVRWMVQNLACQSLYRPHFYTRLRYEDFVAMPSDAVSTVLRSLRLDCAGIDVTLQEDSYRANMGVQHTVSGNPMRFHEGPLIIRLDDDWKHEMLNRDRRSVAVISAPLFFGYGYRWGKSSEIV